MTKFEFESGNNTLHCSSLLLISSQLPHKLVGNTIGPLIGPKLVWLLPPIGRPLPSNQASILGAPKLVFVTKYTNTQIYKCTNTPRHKHKYNQSCRADNWITEKKRHKGKVNKLAKARKMRKPPGTLGLKKFLGQKSCWVKKVFLVKIVFGSKKKIGEKRFLGQKKVLGSK